MNLKKALLPILVLAAAGVGGAALIATAPEPETEERREVLRTVRVVEAIPQQRRLTVQSQGTVKPRTESELIPEISGRVIWSSPNLASGGFFEEGEILLRVDRHDYESAQSRAKASLARAEGEWEHAKATLDRREELARQGVASSSQLDDARRQARVAEATLSDAKIAVSQAARDLERTRITAPFTGRVREEHVDQGQFITRGQSIASLYATDYVEVRLPIPDKELAYLDLALFGGSPVAEGPVVTLRAVFAGQPQEWVGRVVRTEGEIDTKSRMVHVVARVEDPYEVTSGSAPLAVGLFVEAEIEGPLAEDVIRVPRGAMREGDTLLIVDAEDRLQSKKVQLMRLERDDALVRSELPSGTRVCVSQIETFVPGMRVKPQLMGENGRVRAKAAPRKPAPAPAAEPPKTLAPAPEKGDAAHGAHS